MMRYACLVRARSAEERPAVDGEGTAPEGPEVGGTETPGGAAADEYGVVLTRIIEIHIPDGLADLARLGAVNNVPPLRIAEQLSEHVHDHQDANSDRG